VSPLSLTMIVDSVHLPSTVSAARDPVAWRDVDDDAILVELDAEDSGGLESEEDSEYARGAHWDRALFLVFGDFEDTCPCRTSATELET
jgi:hypothetical protein